MPRAPRIESFALRPGRVIAGKYEVTQCIGAGWEGEVYLIKERSTEIERAAKLFFPDRNRNDHAFKFYARKLHELRHVPIIIQYHARETIRFQQTDISCLISEYVAGELLIDFLSRQRGKRLHAFQALHLLHALASGVEGIHEQREYHGDLHSGNVIVQRCGLGFELKLIDLYRWGSPKAENIKADVLDMIRIFYEAIGGPQHYAGQPQEIKAIVCGMKRSLIEKKFKTAGALRTYLETMEWQ